MRQGGTAGIPKGHVYGLVPGIFNAAVACLPKMNHCNDYYKRPWYDVCD